MALRTVHRSAIVRREVGGVEKQTGPGNEIDTRLHGGIEEGRQVPEALKRELSSFWLVDAPSLFRGMGKSAKNLRAGLDRDTHQKV